ncbi:MAG: hypothetical protein EOM64_06785 [Erysipelotrichia bacterium]|nr:hypothetical protein [Erysipelotrichia bacterium]
MIAEKSDKTITPPVKASRNQQQMPAGTQSGFPVEIAEALGIPSENRLGNTDNPLPKASLEADH